MDLLNITNNDVRVCKITIITCLSVRLDFIHRTRLVRHGLFWFNQIVLQLHPSFLTIFYQVTLESEPSRLVQHFYQHTTSFYPFFDKCLSSSIDGSDWKGIGQKWINPAWKRKHLIEKTICTHNKYKFHYTYPFYKIRTSNSLPISSFAGTTFASDT